MVLVHELSRALKMKIREYRGRILPWSDAVDDGSRIFPGFQSYDVEKPQN